LSKINFGYARAAGMPHIAHHGNDAVYGQQKTFAPLGLSKGDLACAKAFKLLKQNEAVQASSLLPK